MALVNSNNSIKLLLIPWLKVLKGSRSFPLEPCKL